MDLGFSEEQEMLRTMARDFLANECPKSLVREMEEDEKGYSPELWRKMAELGWFGLAFPEKYGGTEGTFLDLSVLIEEMGRALLPGPFVPTVVQCGLTIMNHGSEEQKQQFLPKIANGDLIMTLALTEPMGRYGPDSVTLKAEAKGDDFILNGVKLVVPDAHVSDYMIVVARTRDGADKADGVTLLMVDAKSAGIGTTTLKTIASDKLCEVKFDNVRVPKANVLGRVDKGWAIVKDIMEKATVAQSLLLVGEAQVAFEMSVQYAKDRVQFGRPIGSFQAIQHKCANMVTDVDGARFITYQAAWRVSEGLPAAMEISMAKAWTSDATRRVVSEAHQIHAGIGFTKDYDLQLYFRRQKAGEVTWGDGDWHRELVAQQLGL